MGLLEESFFMVVRLLKYMLNEIYYLIKWYLGRLGVLNFYMGCNKFCI